MAPQVFCFHVDFQVLHLSLSHPSFSHGLGGGVSLRGPGLVQQGGEKVIVLRWGCFICVRSPLPHVPNKVAEASRVVD